MSDYVNQMLAKQPLTKGVRYLVQIRQDKFPWRFKNFLEIKVIEISLDQKMVSISMTGMSLFHDIMKAIAPPIWMPVKRLKVVAILEDRE